MSAVENKILTERKTDYDLLRILLILLVVLGHINYTGYDANLYFGISKFFISNAEKFLSWVYSFHMPAFMFLSGLLFSIEKYDSVDKLAWDKFKKLVIPTYLLQAIVIIPLKLCTGMIGGGEAIEKYYSLFSGIEGVYDHLWFMMALFWVCIFFYFPCKFLFNRKNIVLGFIVCIFLVYYIPLLPFSHDYYLFKTGVSYLLVFAFGWVYNSKQIGKNIKIVYKLFYLLCYMCFSVNKSGLDENNLYVLQIAGILAVTFLIEIISVYIHSETAKKIIIFLSEESRYIYYFHVPLIWISVLYFRKIYTTKSVIGYFLLEILGCIILPIFGHRILNKLIRIIIRLKSRETKLKKEII